MTTNPPPRNTYVLEPAGGVWVLRRFGCRDVLAASFELDRLVSHSFDRLREAAPCVLRILDNQRDEWWIDSTGGPWEKGATSDHYTPLGLEPTVFYGFDAHP